MPKRNYIYRSLAILLFLLSTGYGYAQITAGQVGRYYTEPVFTQYMSGMQYLNPAYVGIWDRVGVQFNTRQDFAGQSGAPMSMYFGAYKPVKNNKNGIGLNISYETVGYEEKLTVAADYAFEVKINWETFLRLGLKVGIVNYSNFLSKYLTDPGVQVPDNALMTDIEQQYMLKWGVGALLYSPKYYISLSSPQLVRNKFRADIMNYSSIAESIDLYLMAGYYMSLNSYISFKPTMKVRLGFGEGGTSALDIGANFMFWDKFWLGGLYRTDNTFAIISQLKIIKNTTIGYAMELPLGTDIGKQLQTHEIRIVYEYDFFRRENMRHAYF